MLTELVVLEKPRPPPIPLRGITNSGATAQARTPSTPLHNTDSLIVCRSYLRKPLAGSLGARGTSSNSIHPSTSGSRAASPGSTGSLCPSGSRLSACDAPLPSSCPASTSKEVHATAHPTLPRVRSVPPPCSAPNPREHHAKHECRSIPDFSQTPSRAASIR
ncbi:hypothetical protein TRAPUB_13203 [Trametes pubescens]|uniref:Uncharacterized protein n=1 Tax=Trametes pubescens TaxID=154538 RepID=A0A1M2VRT6_TRAPU|nr:hypothetical protein TRAPUB_13203 [Trametes pubescens]